MRTTLFLAVAVLVTTSATAADYLFRGKLAPMPAAGGAA